MSDDYAMAQRTKKKVSPSKIVWVIGLAIMGAAAMTTWWINQYLYAATFDPVKLEASEQEQLDGKMQHLSRTQIQPFPPSLPSGGEVEKPLRPEPYSEKNRNREILLTEREVNALIAKNPRAAEHVAVDLAEDLVSVKMIVPVRETIPILGGQTIKLNFGVQVDYKEGEPVIAMKGISLGGVPLPSSWWGEIKHKNLVKEFSGAGGFWDQFAKGVKDLQVKEGSLWVQLEP